jgi:hypothetical protein
MTECERIRDQIHRAVHGEAWHGPGLKELLAGVGAAQAASRPLPAAHSIWELVHHITAWATIVRRRIESAEKIEVTAEVDWPPVNSTDDASWSAALDRLEASHAALERTVAGLSPEALLRKAPGSDNSAYVLLLGVLQHGLYHGGQIALLRKALKL